jgi:hypothetical protein
MAFTPCRKISRAAGRNKKVAAAASRFPWCFRAATLCVMIDDERVCERACQSFAAGSGQSWWTARSKSKNYSTRRLSTSQKSDNQPAASQTGETRRNSFTQLCLLR